MDLGIAGRKAIVGGASSGLGKACAVSLAREGVEVFIVARTRKTLEATADEIAQSTDSLVNSVAVDITTDAGRAAVLEACPAPDIVVNNTGGPPLGDFRGWDRETWFAALNANMLSAIFMIRDTVDGMIERRFGRVVNITSNSVKAPIGILGLSNGARSGLTGFVAGIARQAAPFNVAINNLLPGSFETDRAKALMRGQAEAAGIPYEEMRAQGLAKQNAGRFGDPAEFGDFCAYLCSAQAGHICGQNLLMDGGTYPGTF